MIKASNIKEIYGVIVRKYFFQLLFVLALVLFAFSFVNQDYNRRLKREVRQVEKSLHKREKILDYYSERALSSNQNWVGFDQLPEDMVIYRYNSDTLQSWVNQFPIGNDMSRALPFMYRLQYLSSRNPFFMPLAYVGDEKSFVNLGSSWYVISTRYSDNGDIKVVSGLLIKSINSGGERPETTNPKLKIRKGYSLQSLIEGTSSVVYSRSGEALFSIVADSPLAISYGNSTLRWLSFLLLVLSVFPIHFRLRRWRTFWGAISVLALIRVFTIILVAKGIDVGDFFSPMLYGDSRLFASLGSLVLNNVLISLAVYALFAMRLDLFKRVMRSGKKKRLSVAALLTFSALALVVYIHAMFKSLTFNSNIVFELFRIDQMTFYSIVCYFTFAMLFLSLLFLIQMAVDYARGDLKANMMSWRYIVPFTVAVSFLSVVLISVYNLDKEYEINRMRTNKLAIDRDLNLEIYLRSIEEEIASDQFIAMLASVNGVELISNRLRDRYFFNQAISSYNISLSLCGPGDLINVGGPSSDALGCFKFYDDMIMDFGVNLYEGSHFLYLNKYNGLTSYLGVFTYVDEYYNTSRLFFEIESKNKKDVIANPFDVFNSSAIHKSSIPSGYSYARYSHGRLVNSGGKYNYPVAPVFSGSTGYRVNKAGGYVHFVNVITDDDITIVSRPNHPFFPYIVSFSYLVLFYGIFIMLFTVWGRKTRILVLPRHTLKRKLTLLITCTMVGALLCMGVGSVFYVARLDNARLQTLMGEKMSAVQNSLSKYCRYAMRYTELDMVEMAKGMEEASALLQTDVNLYDVSGFLIRSTNPDVFEQNIVGRRMNNRAFEEIVFNNSQRYVTIDRVGDVTYNSLYSPLFNDAGDMVGIVNIPYFYNNEDVRTTNVSAISTIINIYIILLLVALAVGAVLSNSISRPLAEIKKKMDHLALSGTNKHIKYKNIRDELGVLIQSYNKMLDDLEESTIRLAQNEREQAWKEMARQIAHEIKNPLTPMRLSIQYLMRLKEQNVPGWEDKMEVISKSLLEKIDTLSETASAFSSYSKFYSEQAVEVDLDELLKQQFVLFDNRDNIHIKYLSYCTNAMTVVRRSQIARVIVNLVTNSIQAIENSSAPQGHIFITLSEDELNGHKAYKVMVEDDGPGVKEENLDRLFTPNFTTKSGGTGLGLAICRSIVEQSQGTISYCRSANLKGACFSILLLAKEDL